MNVNPSETVGSIYTVVENFIKSVITSGPASISEASKPATLIHKVIIEESLANNSLMAPLIALLNQQVIAWVLTSIQLGSCVTGSTTVRDIISTIATESFVDSVELIDFNMPGNSLDKKVISVESNTSTVDMELKSTRLLSTRVEDITLKTGPSKDDFVVLRIGVHLVPDFVSTEIMGQMLDIYNEAGVILRWRKTMVGELHWFKGFLLSLDQLEKYDKTLRSDRTNKLGQILSYNRSKEMRGLAERYAKIDNKNQNQASTIIIADRRVIEQNKLHSGSDLDEYIARARFFNKSLSMILCVVDDMFNNVKIYYNGYKSVTTATFDMLNRVGQKSDQYDLKDVLTALGSNQNIKY